MKDKVEAVYALREAAEAHGRAEAMLEAQDTPAGRDEVLDKKVELEARTAEAIDSCHFCGRPHHDDHPHSRATVTHTPEGVIELHFKPLPEGDTKSADEDPPA